MIIVLLRTAAMRRILPVFVLLAAMAVTARAGVGFTLTPPLSVGQGSLGTLSGSLSNTGPDPVYFNAVSFQFLSVPVGAVTDPNDPNVALSLFFDGSAPFSLTGTANPGAPTLYTGPLFDIQTAPAAALGTYSLRITLQGGVDSSAGSPLSFYDFNQTVGPPVAPVPELSSAVGFGLMTVLFACGMRRRRSCLPS